MRETVEQLDVLGGELHADVTSDETPVATIDLPDGAAVADNNDTLQSDALTDGGFGELERSDEDDERFEIPRQPTADTSEVIASPEPPATAGKVAVERAVERPRREQGAIGRTGKPDRVEQAPRKQDLAEIPEVELQKSPQYQRLAQEGDAGVALRPYLHRLTVSKTDAPQRERASRHMHGDAIDKGLVDRLGDESGALDNPAGQELTGILDHSLRVLQERPDLVEGDSVNWLELSTALLDQAVEMGKQVDYGDRLTVLTSATTAVMMSEKPQDRIAFLQHAAEQNLGYHMGRALNQSKVSVVQGGFRDADVSMLPSPDLRDDRSIQRLSNFSTAFNASFDDVTRYWELTERNFDEPVDAHRAMKDAVAGYDDHRAVVMGVGNVETLEEASVAPDYVDRFRIDPTKAERFALEEMFVQAQMESLFPDGDPGRFERMLADTRRMGSSTDQLVNLRRHVQELIGGMSHDATKDFYVPAGSPSPDWTRAQLAAWRYRDLAKEAVVYDDIVKFVDPSVFGRPSNIRTDIYSISQNGAALPDMVTQAMGAVMQMAGDYEAASGDRVSPEELRDLLQGNRRQLMKLAAQNADHLSASFTSGSIGSAELDDRRPTVKNPTTIERGQDGSLALKGPIFHPDKASSQSAARLACVALRVNVDEKPKDEGEPAKKINSIELLTRIMIDEAYQRGILKAGLVWAA